MPRTFVLAATSIVLALGAFGISRVIAVPASPSMVKQQKANEPRLVEQVRRGGGGRVARTARVSRSAHVGRRTNVRTARTTNAVRRTNVSANRRTNVVNRTNINRRVVVRPVRPWVRRPYYGRVVAGVALGSVILATAAGVAPAAPGPNLCWFWSNSSRTRGYWDYCSTPG